MSLKVSIKIPPIPELKAANLTKNDLEPVWRSAANGVATAVKTHFLSLPGERFWGEASEKVRVVPLSRNRWQIGVYQRGVRLQYQGGTVKPTGKPSEVTGKPTKSIFIPRQDGPIRAKGDSLFEFLRGRAGADTVRAIKRKGSGKVFLVMDMEERHASPYVTKTGKIRNRYNKVTPLRILGSLVKQATVPAHPEVMPSKEELHAAATEAAQVTLNKVLKNL